MLKSNRYLSLLLLLWFTNSTLATSLYDPNKYVPLHADKRAHHVGDALTILIFENTQATASAGDGSNGEFSFSGGAAIDDRNWNAGLNLGSRDAGDASTIRNGFVRAQITTRVVAIDKYGDLSISGSQEIVVNEETQLIDISGTVRPDDISADNTVPSFRIIDARLKIDGEGSVSSGKDENMFARLAKWLGFSR